MSACFLPYYPTHFISLDVYNTVRVQDTRMKAVVWSQTFPMDCCSMAPHAQLPIAMVGTMDGRIIAVGFQVSDAKRHTKKSAKPSNFYLHLLASKFQLHILMTR